MRDYRRTLDRILSPSHRPGGIKARPGKRSWVNNNQLLEDLSTSLVPGYQHSSAGGSPVSDDYYLDWDRSTRQADGCAATIGGDNPYAGLQIIYDWGTRDTDLPVLLVDVDKTNRFRLEVPVPEYLWQAGWVASGAVAADEVDREICVRQFADWVLKTVRNATTAESYVLNAKLDRILSELDGKADANTILEDQQAADTVSNPVAEAMQPVGILDRRLVLEDQEADSAALDAAVAKLSLISREISDK